MPGAPQNVLTGFSGVDCSAHHLRCRCRPPRIPLRCMRLFDAVVVRRRSRLPIASPGPFSSGRNGGVITGNDHPRDRFPPVGLRAPCGGEVRRRRASGTQLPGSSRCSCRSICDGCISVKAARRSSRTARKCSHLSEHAAYGRIEAARAVRRFPIILDRLIDGSLTLTAVTLLAPHLMTCNCLSVIADARHKSKRDIEHIVARLRPQPAVAATVRKLPDAAACPIRRGIDLWLPGL